MHFFLTEPLYSYNAHDATWPVSDGVGRFRETISTKIPDNQANKSIALVALCKFDDTGKPIEEMQKTKKYQINQQNDVGSRKKRLGEVVVIEDRCKGCGFCIANCPRQVLRVSSIFNKKGYHPPEVNDASRCVNCHFCEILCPEFAIYSIENNDLNEV